MGRSRRPLALRAPRRIREVQTEMAHYQFARTCFELALLHRWVFGDTHITEEQLGEQLQQLCETYLSDLKQGEKERLANDSTKAGKEAS